MANSGLRCPRHPPYFKIRIALASSWCTGTPAAFMSFDCPAALLHAMASPLALALAFVS
jgi:hypothetical protein